jgi:5-methylcytosine-specific restriction endonuclease McrBC regulatory subunit McrC
LQLPSIIRHYHRLNDDYQPSHALCKFFLDRVAFSEKLGAIAFRGFLLDMNQPFEDFITQAFLIAAKTTSLSALAQRETIYRTSQFDLGQT